MGHYYADERDDHVLCEPQKNGLAGTALGLGAGGLAAAVPALVMSIISLVRDGRRHEAERLARANQTSVAEATAMYEKCAAKDATIAALTAERYSDKGDLDIWKAAQQQNQAQDDRNAVRFEKAFDAIVETKVLEARNDEKFKCLAGDVARIQNVVQDLSVAVCDIKGNERVTAEKLTNLAESTHQGFHCQDKLRNEQSLRFDQALKGIGAETALMIQGVEKDLVCKTDCLNTRITTSNAETRLWVQSQGYVQGSNLLRRNQICNGTMRDCCGGDNGNDNGNSNGNGNS